MRDLPETATEIASLVTSGTIRVGDALARSLHRVARDNPGLNAIIRLNPQASAEVTAVHHRLQAGELLPLAGVPVVIKDNLWVAGLAITQGSQLFADFVAPTDAVAVARLRAAGAIILGIGATSEFACIGVTNTQLYGMTRNPIDPSLTPGGSSGGPSAAVAAGFAPLALGTDAGGSTRRPPAHVGVIGFKPSQDLVPYGPGFEEPVWGISVICPIARNMVDIALAMRVLTGQSLMSQIARPALAYAAHFGLDQPLDADVARVTDSAVDRLRRAGYPVETAAPVWPEGSGRADVAPLQWAGLAALYGAAFRHDPSRFGDGIADQIMRGLGLRGVEVAQAHQASHRMGETLRAFLGRHPFVITPTTPCPAWPVEDVAPRFIGGLAASPRDHAAFTSQANHAGSPAISLPCGHTSTGLPLGLQIMAAPGADAALLALAQDVAPMLAGQG
ncbi:MAG: amidase [Pseudotabrizicola sp.]|uniref:amidase n=1 Tax=Pseudotabrizicola sp. TaxID=2939647 RepID=UPI0027321EE3|nr:amidase [Pseudotabrizicola sp.]MDP2079871.1 amidase [Pseudotabrizicola sp.]MDZ7573182.1 amidase [Pseudotabrizicola sp.]